ncbi:MAG: MgtC/SapB family protein [Chloroflexi bacterium]|nr:MgtC/SapB family protein [Chloroflexota bacterium]
MQAWQLTPWPELDLVLRLLLAAVIGGIIGYERELAHKPAGLRTHSLVCVGACLFTIASATGFGPGTDPSRISAGIVVGIGFLGAGTIMREERAVIGLTTAATVWAVSAIGLAVGAGLYFLAIATALIVYVALRFPRHPGG